MPARRRVMRFIIAVALLILGVVLLIGCIPIPGPEKVSSGRDFRRFIDPHSKSPHIQVGMTRSQVEWWLGTSGYQEAKGRIVVYELGTIDGFYLVPLCFKTQERRHMRELRLVYDEEDVLRTWSIKDWVIDVNPVGLLPGE